MFKVINKLELASGVVVLSAAQAALRAHNIKKLSGNRYEILRPVQFKVGEEIEYEGELPKALAEKVVGEHESICARLTELGIEYSAKAKVPALKKLLKEAEDAAVVKAAADKAAAEKLEADLVEVKEKLKALNVNFDDEASLQDLQTLLANEEANK